MIPPKETRVFILGAGCSAECGYPLGTHFKSAFKQFHSELSDGCTTIKQCAAKTIALMENLPDIQTLDQLARHIDDELKSWRDQRGWKPDPEDSRRENLARTQILDAKIATAAMFLFLEEKTPKNGLARYDGFITSILGGVARSLKNVFRDADYSEPRRGGQLVPQSG